MTTETLDDRAAPVMTAAQALTLIGFASVVWFAAALFIRFAGPSGVFYGVRGVVLYGLTVPGTILVNRRALRLAGLPRRLMTTVIAVTTATATMLDGVAMSAFPALYGPDPGVMGAGAIWLLWAIGVASALAVVTSVRAA